MRLEFPRHIFEKSLNIKFYQNLSSGSRIVPCWITKATHTHTLIIYNTFCFSTATRITWTCLNVRLYKVVQIWPGLFVCKQITVCPGHIWTTLYVASRILTAVLNRILHGCRIPNTSQCFKLDGLWKSSIRTKAMFDSDSWLAAPLCSFQHV